MDGGSNSKPISQGQKGLEDLRQLILDGTYAPGERLSEPVLAERLEISRTPLRAAMASLVEEGLLERLSSGGCRVRRYTIGDIIDSIEVRGTMEGLAARLAAERGADPKALKACYDILDQIDVALAAPGGIDFTSYVDRNADFHMRIAELSGSPIVVREVDRIYRLPLASPSAFLRGQEVVPAFRSSLTGAQVQHRAILDAISAREGARAEALAREHARLARQNLEYALSVDRDLSDRIPGLSLIDTGQTN